jgi:hypothetical protein
MELLVGEGLLFAGGALGKDLAVTVTAEPAGVCDMFSLLFLLDRPPEFQCMICTAKLYSVLSFRWGRFKSQEVKHPTTAMREQEAAISKAKSLETARQPLHQTWKHAGIFEMNRVESIRNGTNHH